MCNLYRMTSGTAEIAKLFGSVAVAGANFGSEVYPGYPGLVVTSDQVLAMTWGFPLSLRGKSGQLLKPKPVNNARTDKLASGFWRPSFESRRCLIPVSAWAEAQGPKGAMTRTWLSLPQNEPFAVGGLWRPTQEWGASYSMVMTDSSPQMADIHTRMPVILRTEHWRPWLEASVDDALALCRTWDGDLRIEPTSERWAR
jgi:putative SOS response-associated peptidase YedK